MSFLLESQESAQNYVVYMSLIKTALRTPPTKTFPRFCLSYIAIRIGTNCTPIVKPFRVTRNWKAFPVLIPQIEYSLPLGFFRSITGPFHAPVLNSQYLLT